MQVRRGSPRRRQNLFGGTGDVLVWDLLEGAAAPPFRAVLSCELAEAGRVGPHVQEHFDEIVIGLSGCGHVRVAGEEKAFGPGAVIHLPVGATLEIVNERPDAPLRYLIVKAERQRGS